MKRAIIFFVVALLSLSGFEVYKKRDRILLWRAIQVPQPQWVKEQINRDFLEVASITQEALKETFQKIQSHSVLAYRYRVIDGNIFRIGEEGSLGRARQFEKILRRIHKAKKLPNLDFIVCLGDGVPEFYHAPDFWITEKQAPLLAWAKRKELAPHVVLIPDLLTTKESSWHQEIEAVNEMYKKTPWQEKKEIAFWRGASNDKGYTLDNYRQKPRFLISLLSSLSPHLVNAGFSYVHPPEMEAVLQPFVTGGTSIANHLSYKYLPVLDGYMCTYPGFQWRLLSGSLTLKQDSDEIQYFYSALTPFEHYLPIRNDMSDLLEKIQWAKEHDAECKQMAKNARKFALEYLMPNSIYAYFYWVLEKYASLQDFPVWEEIAEFNLCS